MNYYFKIFIVSFLILGKGYSQTSNEDDSQGKGKIHKGWNKLLGFAGDALDDATKQEDLSILLFRELAASQGKNFGLYTENFDASDLSSEVPVSAGISISFNRNVVDNKNVKGTYSVIDRMVLGFSPSAYLKLIGIPFLNAHAGGAPFFTFEVFNIRNVAQKKYLSIPTLEEVKNNLKKRINKEKNKKPFKIDDPNTIEEEDRKFSLFFPDLSGIKLKKSGIKEAYFGRLGNPLTQVFRLPLTMKSLKKMGNNEILSYSLSGGIAFGSNLGSNIGISKITSILKVDAFDINFSVSGKHQISVLKEAPKKSGDNFVRVKLSRLKPKTVSARMGTGDPNIIQKWLNLEGTITWSGTGGIIRTTPYKFPLKMDKPNFYDITYRFNLNKEEGKKAYLKAVLGNFKLAGKYSDEKYLKSIGGNESTWPVNKIYTKNQKKRIKNFQQIVKLFLLELDRKKVFSNTYKWIIIGGKVHKYFETDVLSKKNLKLLFKYHKNRSHRFTLNINLNTFKNTPLNNDSMTLFVNASYRDDFIPVRRYLRYVDEIEMALDRPDFLPLPPIDSEKKNFIKGTLGKCDLSYSLKIKRPALEKLIHYPENKMWTALIDAFQAKGKGWENKAGRAKWMAARMAVYGLTLPVSALGIRLPQKDDIIVAKIKYSRWKKLKDYKKDPTKISHALGKFFQSGDYGPEMVRLLRIVMKGEKVAMNGSFRSDLLGKEETISIGKAVAWSDPTTQNINRSFDQYRNNYKGISATGLVINFTEDKKVEINFNLEKEPKKVFFQLESKNISGVFTNKTEKIIVLDNKNKIFKKGLNSFVIGPDKSQHFLSPIVERIKSKKGILLGHRYRLSVAASLNGIHFGAVVKNDFRYRP